MSLSPMDRETLYDLEESLWRSETRFDTALMEAVFAADFVEVGCSGRRYSREEMFFDPERAPKIDARLPLPTFTLTEIAPDVVLATYRSEVRYGDEFEHGHRSSLWSKINDRWQLRYHQGTAC